jgi:hypothetical protein
MATNPRIPSSEVTERPERGPQLVASPAAPQEPRSSVPGVLAAIVIAIVLIVAFVYYMPGLRRKPQVPSAAEVPAQPVGSQLQFSGMQLAVAPTGGAVNLDGQVTNAGDNPITGAMARLTFRDASGAVVGTSTSPLEGMTNAGERLVRDDFLSDPLKPKEDRLKVRSWRGVHSCGFPEGMMRERNFSPALAIPIH